MSNMCKVFCFHAVIYCIYFMFSGYTKSQDFHVSSARPLPCAAPLPLPDNVQDINASEIGRFSPLRNRDITGSVISSHELDDNVRMEKFDITTEADPHIEPYDCRGAVNLSSSMQSNVPQPFKGQHCFFGMPGSQWGQGHKYLLDNLNSSHYLNLRNHYRRNFHTGYSFHKGNEFDLLTKRLLSHDIVRTYCDKVKTDIGKNMSTKEKLKQAVAAYGSTVIVFHVTISLISLGACYLLVSRYETHQRLLDKFSSKSSVLFNSIC